MFETGSVIQLTDVIRSAPWDWNDNSVAHCGSL